MAVVTEATAVADQVLDSLRQNRADDGVSRVNSYLQSRTKVQDG